MWSYWYGLHSKVNTISTKDKKWVVLILSSENAIIGKEICKHCKCISTLNIHVLCSLTVFANVLNSRGKPITFTQSKPMICMTSGIITIAWSHEMHRFNSIIVYTAGAASLVTYCIRKESTTFKANHMARCPSSLLCRPGRVLILRSIE